MNRGAYVVRPPTQEEENMEKQALLAVSFGTSHFDTLEKTIAAIEADLAAAFPEGLGWLGVVPTQLYQALPFLITAVVLVVTSIRQKGTGQPAGLGLNYFREER